MGTCSLILVRAPSNLRSLLVIGNISPTETGYEILQCRGSIIGRRNAVGTGSGRQRPGAPMRRQGSSFRTTSVCAHQLLAFQSDAGGDATKQRRLPHDGG